MTFVHTIAARYGTLRIKCIKCGHEVHVPPQRITEMFPATMNIGWAKFRLRCKACGGRRPIVEVLRHPPR